MKDLDVARKRLREKELSLCIVKGGEVIFETASHGISGFLKAVEEFGDKLVGASVADRVVGKAIALLCVCARVARVYGSTLSEKAKALFDQNAIHVEWDELVDNVLGANKTETCPFESLASEIANPKDAYRKLKALQDSLKECR